MHTQAVHCMLTFKEHRTKRKTKMQEEKHGFAYAVALSLLLFFFYIITRKITKLLTFNIKLKCHLWNVFLAKKTLEVNCPYAKITAKENNKQNFHADCSTFKRIVILRTTEWISKSNSIWAVRAPVILLKLDWIVLSMLSFVRKSLHNECNSVYYFI